MIKNSKKNKKFMSLISNGVKKIPKISALFFVPVLFFLFSGRVLAAPYSSSDAISGISWDESTLKRTAYGSDNFPTTWSDDDNIYTIWGDGAGFNATAEESGVEPYRVGLGVARISGSPGSFSATNIFGGKNALNQDTFGGKAYGILSVGGVLYILQGPEYSPAGDEAGGWDAAVESTVGVSYDHGASWWRSGIVLTKSDGFCSPGFLNFGKDYAGARDDYVYIYGRDCSGMDGSTMYQTAKISLARVPIGSITERSSYEFYSGTSGSEAWASNSANRKPVFINNIGYPEPQSYDAPSAVYYSDIGRYILIVTHGTPGSPRGGMGIYDGPSPWGPWTTVTYDDNWMGSDRLFYANMPTKWINGNDFYLVFTGTTPDPIAEDAYQHMKGTFVLGSSPDPSNVAPSGSIIIPASDGSSVTKGSTLNFSGTVSDADSSSLNVKWYVDRLGDGLENVLIKEVDLAPGTTSGTVTMSGTKTSTIGQTISLEDVGVTYNLYLDISDGVNPTVRITRSFTLTDSTPSQFCGDQSCNNGETCSTCSQDCGECPQPAKTYTITDFTKLVQDWLKSMVGSPADVNLDNKVNSRDLGIMMSNWDSGGVIPPPPGGTGCNTQINGSFTQNISGWGIDGGNSTLSWQNLASGDGSTGYMRFNISDNGDYDRLAVDTSITAPSTTYQVSFWYRTSGIIGDLQVFSTDDLGSLGNTSWAGSKITPSTSWKQFSTTLSTNGTSYPVFGIAKLGSIGAGTLDIDGISVCGG